MPLVTEWNISLLFWLHLFFYEIHSFHYLGFFFFYQCKESDVQNEKHVAKISLSALPLKWNKIRLHCHTKSVFHLCSPVICVCWGPCTHTALFVLVLPYLQRKIDAGKCQRFTSLTASQVAVSIETGKVCTVSLSICVNEPYHNTPKLVWVDRRRLQEPFHSVAQCLHIAPFRRQRQLLPQSFFCSIWFRQKAHAKYILTVAANSWGSLLRLCFSIFALEIEMFRVF